MGLRLMKNDKIVAYGKLTSTDRHALWDDGRPFGDYCEVMIDVVREKNLPLPRPFAKIAKLGQALHHSIAWPFANVCQLQTLTFQIYQMHILRYVMF